jgi:5'-3' exoribonuclease 2
MNGIIHSSMETDTFSTVKNEDEIMESIVQRIDRIFSIVRPSKLLYMATDGVAPMARMNHQRAGRFQDAKDNQNEDQHFNKNLIKLGTPFMSKLSNYLQNYIRVRMNTDSAWSSIKLFYPMQMYLVKVNIKQWITYVHNQTMI